MHKKSNQLNRTFLTLGFLGLFALYPIHAYAQNEDRIIGIPVVQDSGTLLINGKKIKLWGIKTLAADQQCWQGDLPWCCGEGATSALKHFIQGKAVKCDLKTQNEDGSISAQCTRRKGLLKKDLAQHLVKRGLAVSDNEIYSAPESRAKKHNRGIWSGHFQSAQDWKDGVLRYISKK